MCFLNQYLYILVFLEGLKTTQGLMMMAPLQGEKIGVRATFSLHVFTSVQKGAELRDVGWQLLRYLRERN